ncbi:MAG: glycosyltransferase family 39 protein [Parcubacteria group bacterium]|jgi:4-amino-4-deoxy-L-arabinose transferase-like glycosyltransferase
MKNKKIISYSLLFIIITLGFFLRFYNIDNIPPGIYPDEAVNGQDAIQANETGDYQWFYPANQGREGLFMNLIAFCFKFFGISILTLKLPAIVFGTLTILGTYLLTKELFHKENTALAASFLYATSFWAINFSRISFRANLLPFILVFSFYFLFRGLRTKRWWDFAIGGFIFGVGMHTYIAWRVAPAILLLMLIFFALSRKNFFKEYWKSILIFLLFSLLAAFPMFLTFYQHPEYFEARSDSISILSPTVNKGNLFGTFLRSFSLSLIKYNFVGDMNWRHNFPPYPLLDPLTNLAFLFGIIFSLKTFFHTLYLRIYRKIPTIHLEKYAFLLVWFLILLSPEFMTGEGNPHALRSIGTLPAVIILVSLPFNYLIEKSKKNSKFYQKIILTILLAMLLSSGIFNAIKYHYVWANKEKVGLSFNKNITDMAKYINTLPKEQEKFVITSYNTIEKAPADVLTHSHTVTFFYPNELQKMQPTTANFMIFFTENNRDAMNELQQRFPNLNLSEVDGTLGSVYYVLK